MSGMFRRFIRWQVGLSKRIDERVFGAMSLDGNGHYLRFISEVVRDGSVIADVGGGKRPFFSPDTVVSKRLSVTGIDIDGAELERAPTGAYARVIVSPLEGIDGPATHDIVIAQSVLEHVINGEQAILGCASLLRSGGELFTFCPNRRAWFAVLNRVLPENIKRKILFGIFPEKREKQGFPAHYDGCTPDEMRSNMAAAGLNVIRIDCFFVSSYFMFFFPLYLLWRLVNFPLMKIWPYRYCETFAIHAVKR